MGYIPNKKKNTADLFVSIRLTHPCDVNLRHGVVVRSLQPHLRLVVPGAVLPVVHATTRAADNTKRKERVFFERFNGEKEPGKKNRGTGYELENT